MSSVYKVRLHLFWLCLLLSAALLYSGNGDAMNVKKIAKNISDAVTKAGKGAAKSAEKKLSPAEKILARIDTPEKAVALTGAERAEYLKALDEVQGPRDARQADLGFGNDTYYHGSTENVDSFNPEKNINSSVGAGTYFTKNPMTASDYANKAMKPEGRAIIKNNQGNPEKIRELLDEGGHVGAYKVRGKTVEVGSSDIPEKTAGADNVFSYSNKELINKNPAAVRSTNAAFDKRFKDSPLLMAGRANAIDASPAATAVLSRFITNKDLGVEPIDAPNSPAAALTGQGKFKDTGRAADGIAESIDSMTGVPVRVAANELVDNIQGAPDARDMFDYAPTFEPRKWYNSAKKIVNSIGTDPEQAPTGFDVASKVTDNPIVGTAIASGLDLAGLPLPMGGASKGLKGLSVKSVAKDVKPAERISNALIGYKKGVPAPVKVVSNKQLGQATDLKDAGKTATDKFIISGKPPEAPKTKTDLGLERYQARQAAKPSPVDDILQQWVNRAKGQP